MSQIDSGKIGGYAVFSTPSDAISKPKSAAYSVMGPSGDGMPLPKVTAYAVYRPINSVDMVKTIAYAVISEEQVTPPPSPSVTGVGLSGGMNITGGVTIKLTP